jgi:hypothetical protein
MNQQKLEDVVSHINFLIAELNHLRNKILIEDGIHFYVLHENSYTSVEVWDSELLEPRIIFNAEGEVKDEDLIPHLLTALNTLSIRAFKKQIFWESDFEWSKLPENFKKLDEVYRIEKRELSSSIKEEIKERLHALYTMPE